MTTTSAIPFEEIRAAVIAAGAISKAELQATWDLTEEQYSSVKHHFRDDWDLEPGPKRVGVSTIIDSGPGAITED